MINKISGTESIRYNQAKAPTFKSKIIPDKFMKTFLSDKNVFLAKDKKENADIFRDLLYKAKTIANCTDSLLNDGKNDVYQCTNNIMKVNGKKIDAQNIDKISIQILKDNEFNAIKNLIEKLSADFKSDYESANVKILQNLCNNLKQIDDRVYNSTKEIFERISKQINK